MHDSPRQSDFAARAMAAVYVAAATNPECAAIWRLFVTGRHKAPPSRDLPPHTPPRRGRPATQKDTPR
jgi:hypothetical protein